MASPVNATKVTLSSGKVVILREMTMEDQENAAASISSTANQIVSGIKMQKELLKLLILEIDGKPVSATDKEKINSLFKVKEFNQLTSYLKQEMGDEELPKLETLISGDK
jgi:hypothetical protein